MENRDEIKGRLLTLWLEDLKKEKEPQPYSEIENITASDIVEVMALARWLKSTLYPTEISATRIDEHIEKVVRLTSEDLTKQIASNKVAVQESASFSDIIRNTMDLLRIDRNTLQESLAIPKPTLAELEIGSLPPHRFPLDKMVTLLTILRLSFKDVVGLIKKSCVQWTETEYVGDQTQLARMDIEIKGESRRQVLRNQQDKAKEMKRIEIYLSRLSNLLSEL